MSNEIEVAVSGWVAQHPRLIETPGGSRLLNMRVGSTPRRRDAVTGTWADGPTQWFTVVAFRDLAANAALSMHKGDPVLVRGRLALRQWQHEGRSYASNEIVADAIGHDLSKGTALFARTVRRDAAWERAAQVLATTGSTDGPDGRTGGGGSSRDRADGGDPGGIGPAGIGPGDLPGGDFDRDELDAVDLSAAELVDDDLDDHLGDDLDDNPDDDLDERPMAEEPSAPA